MTACVHSTGPNLACLVCVRARGKVGSHGEVGPGWVGLGWVGWGAAWTEQPVLLSAAMHCCESTGVYKRSLVNEQCSSCRHRNFQFSVKSGRLFIVSQSTMSLKSMFNLLSHKTGKQKNVLLFKIVRVQASFPKTKFFLEQKPLNEPSTPCCHLAKCPLIAVDEARTYIILKNPFCTSQSCTSSTPSFTCCLDPP